VQRIAAKLLVLVGLLAGCGQSVVSVPPSVGVATPQIDASAWGAAMCQAVDQFSLGMADPANPAQSRAWVAFEAALSTGDPVAIEATANAVLGHLTEGARSARRASAFPAGAAAAAAWAALLDESVAAVRVLRDGGRDVDRINEARAAIQRVWTGIPAAVEQMRAVPVPAGALPCG
jgi:hypothetical protein